MSIRKSYMKNSLTDGKGDSLLVSSRIYGNFLAVTSIIIWATTYPITDMLLAAWDPLSLAFLRVFGAGVLLVLIAFLPGPSRLRWRIWPIRLALLTGAVGVGIGTLLMNLGFQYSNPVNVAVIATTLPLASVIMGVIRGEEQVTLRISVALCCAIAGGILVSVSTLETPVGFQGGELFMVAAVVLWTWFARVSVTKLKIIPAYSRMALTFIGGGLTLLPFLLLVKWSGVVEIRFALHLTELALPFCLILGVAFSTGFWIMSADRIGVTVAAIHMNVVPFYVVILMLWFGESLIFSQIAGAILVAAGVMIAQLTGRPKSVTVR